MHILSPTIWRLGIKSLFLHPMRSLLTVLGIFIGIASVVWLLAIGEGISIRIQRQIEELGTNNIIVRSVQPVEEDSLNTSSIAIYGVTRADHKALVRTIPSIKHALQIRDVERELHYGPKELHIHLVGCTSEYARVMRLEILEGRFLSAVDVDRKNNHCVLSYELAQFLFPLDSAVGKIIRVRDMPYEVVGVMKQRGAMAAVGSSLAAQDFSDDVYVPITTFWQRIGDWTQIRSSGTRINEIVEISQITFEVNEMDEVMPTADAIRSIMAKRHTQQDYSVVTPLELLEQAKTTRLMFMIFMGLIAAISLIVGGIGIMNIMLATVTERTREIGIRRALGAKRKDIVRQFLAETVVLSSVGGACGVLGGLTCPLIIEWLRQLCERLLPKIMSTLPEAVDQIKPTIVPFSIPLAFGIAVAVGIVFGIYPAMRASKMDPIEALRHE